jgi:hypothetical protein
MYVNAACILYLSLTIDKHIANLGADCTGVQLEEKLEKVLQCTWKQ